MDRWGWISALAEPTFLLAMVVLGGVPLLLLPAPAGLLVSILAVALVMWMDHRVHESVRRIPVRVGAESMPGQSAVVVEALHPVGAVRCGGEVWRAHEIRGRRVEPGAMVHVVRVRGLLLEVEAATPRS